MSAVGIMADPQKARDLRAYERAFQYARDHGHSPSEAMPLAGEVRERVRRGQSEDEAMCAIKEYAREKAA